MGKRTWLETAIATEYLPFLSNLSDDEEGREQAEHYNQAIRESWSQRSLTELSRAAIFDGYHPTGDQRSSGRRSLQPQLHQIYDR
jgi:hypothetical protein